MANFRCERLFVMLDEQVPGLNHLKAVDPVEFAWHDTDDVALQLGLTPLGDFTFAPFERARWRPAAKGLKTVRGLLKHYRELMDRKPEGGEASDPDIAKTIAVLAQVEAVLDAADTKDRRFHLAARDLG